MSLNDDLRYVMALRCAVVSSDAKSFSASWRDARPGSEGWWLKFKLTGETGMSTNDRILTFGHSLLAQVRLHDPGYLNSVVVKGSCSFLDLTVTLVLIT